MREPSTTDAAAVAALNAEAVGPTDTCKATVAEASEGTGGGLGLFAAAELAAEKEVVCENCEVLIVLDPQRCMSCNEKLPRDGYGGLSCSCSAEKYCSKKCKRAAWGCYHRTQCGSVSRAIKELRIFYWNRFVTMEGRGLESVYMPLMMARIAGMIEQSLEDAGLAATCDRDTWRAAWPTWLRTPGRLTDTGRDEIREFMQHPFQGWHAQWRQLMEALCLFNEDVPVDPRGLVWFDFEFFDEMHHMLSANTVGHSNGRAVALMRKATLANHSCEPNATVAATLERVVLKTTRPVAAGEQLTISYVPESEDMYNGTLS